MTATPGHRARPWADWQWREAAPPPLALAAALAIGAFAAAGTVARAVFLGTDPGDAAANAVAEGDSAVPVRAARVRRRAGRSPACATATPLSRRRGRADALTLALAARAALLASAGLPIGAA